ncbi:MAG: hypothetical protein WC967_12610 [Balneolaceae bacterium]
MKKILKIVERLGIEGNPRKLTSLAYEAQDKIKLGVLETLVLKILQARINTDLSPEYFEADFGKAVNFLDSEIANEFRKTMNNWNGDNSVFDDFLAEIWGNMTEESQRNIQDALQLSFFLS